MAPFSDAQDACTTLTPCPRRASPGPHRSGPGAGPHYQRLLCGACGVFLQWLPQPRSAVQEVGGSLIPKAERQRQRHHVA